MATTTRTRPEQPTMFDTAAGQAPAQVTLDALTHAYRDWVSAEALHARARTTRTRAAATSARATYDTATYTLLGGAR